MTKTNPAKSAATPGQSIEDRVAALEANSHPPVDLGPAIEAAVKAHYNAVVLDLFENKLPPLVSKVVDEGFAKLGNGLQGEALQAAINAHLDANLAELVKAAMPPTPEQQAKAERETLEQGLAKARAAAERKAKAERRTAEKAAAEAAAEIAKRDAAAKAEFEAAVPFIGLVDDIKPNILRAILIDDGTAYSADHIITVRGGDLERTTDGGLMLTRTIELPAKGREFGVAGISLITDAGRMRIAINGTRKAGGGLAVQFPARSLIFRPEPAAQD